MILDHRGNPIEKDSLREPQTARLGQLRSEFENHPSRGLTPPKLARILQAAEQGDLIAQHELFQDMEEKDGHLFSAMQTRRLALQGLDWDVVAPENATAQEKELAEFAKAALLGMQDFGDVLFDMTDGIGHGYAALELEWGTVDGMRVPINATHRPQSWLQLSLNAEIGRNELRLRDGSADGAALWPFGWIVHVHRARSGYITRSGLYRVLAWPFLFKNYAVRDLAEFLEIYGLPLRVGTYNPSATKEDKATLLRAVVGIGHDAAAIIPEGMMIDFKNAAQGDNKSFDAMIGLMERTMSKAILGGTLTSGEGEHGTQALGEVHNELRHDLRDADAKQLAASITRQLIYPILAVNKGLSDMRRCPRLVFDTQEGEDIKLYSEAVPKLVSMGMRIPRDWAHEKLKIPLAGENEDVLVAPQPAQPAPGDGQPTELPKAKPGKANLRADPAGAGEDDGLDDLAAEMLGGWQETLGDSLVQPVLDAAESAASLEDFRDALEGRLAEIEPAALIEALAHGGFAARVWGQLNRVTDRDPDTPAAEK
jgi:phage gp29-like protein